MAETKKFPTLVVASTITGIALGKLSISNMHECAEWLCGHPVWTHELAHGPTQDEYITEGYDQFPLMPTPTEARVNYELAAQKAVAHYGESVAVKQGSGSRQESPIRTMLAINPKAEIITFDPSNGGAA